MLIERIKHLGPVVSDEIARIYSTLDRYIHGSNRIGPALSSLDEFCDMYLTVLSDSKDLARIKIARRDRAEIWFWPYHKETDAISIEFLRGKDRGVYGMQFSRWILLDSKGIAEASERHLENAFTSFRVP